MARVVIPGFRKIETTSSGEQGTTNYEELSNKPSINNVPLIGNTTTEGLHLDYDEIENTPAIPVIDTELDGTSENAVQNKVVAAKVNELTQKNTSQDKSLDSLSESVTNLETATSELQAQLDNHTVKSDVPEDAKFTDTVYNDTAVNERISNNGYGEVAGGKNLINNWDYLLKNMSDNADGTTHSYADGQLVINRIANINSGVYIYNKIFNMLANKTVYLSFDAKSSVAGVILRCWINGGEHVNSKELTTDFTHQVLKINVNAITTGNLIIYGSATACTVTLKNFMISYDDSEYEPYFPSNTQLDTIKVDKTETTVNLLNPTLGTTTQNGVTCTNNGDGTYTLNGTATSTVTYLLQRDVTWEATKRLTGCPKDGGAYKYYLDLLNSANNSHYMDLGEGRTIIKSNTGNLRFIIIEGQTLTNVVIKPMLTTNLNATYDDFVPYTGDTGQLNKDVAEIKSDIGDTSTLLTEEKVVVKAINWLKQQFELVKSSITSLSNNVSKLSDKVMTIDDIDDFTYTEPDTNANFKLEKMSVGTSLQITTSELPIALNPDETPENVKTIFKKLNNRVLNGYDAGYMIAFVFENDLTLVQLSNGRPLEEASETVTLQCYFSSGEII